MFNPFKIIDKHGSKLLTTLCPNIRCPKVRGPGFCIILFILWLYYYATTTTSPEVLTLTKIKLQPNGEDISLTAPTPGAKLVRL